MKRIFNMFKSNRLEEWKIEREKYVSNNMFLSLYGNSEVKVTIEDQKKFSISKNKLEEIYFKSSIKERKRIVELEKTIDNNLIFFLNQTIKTQEFLKNTK